MSVVAALHVVAQTADEIKQSWGSLIFTGLFFLALIVVGIWWLRR